ncbi:MAG: exodeoxyribonuclease VII small subunit [Anaerolineales bacterium]|nr:exodeoxyribonuclease VII small subunit [Anaerolineales bacterium]
MPPKSKKSPDRGPSYEKSFSELQEIVAKLEAGDLPLEDALTLYERGQALAKTCSDLLEKAELRIRELGKAAAESTQPD